jgi:hypothetical protein
VAFCLAGVETGAINGKNVSCFKVHTQYESLWDEFQLAKMYADEMRMKFRSYNYGKNVSIRY